MKSYSKYRDATRTPLTTRRQFLRGAGTLGMGIATQRLAWGHGSLAAVPRAAEAPMQASLKIDLERRLGDIDPNIYGNFIEHLGRCIYGGIYDEGSPLSDADGIRKDVLEAARKLRVTQLRWPGGNFVSGYHWQDGIGPKQSRPKRYDLAWFQYESNRFGTDEFMATCRKLHADPYLCVNMGTGTMDEASSWVDYCNRESGTYFSDLRKRNGHAKPYGVKLWGLGNEMHGSWQIGHKDSADYAKAALEFAKVMKWQDPSIKLIACGRGDAEWDRPVLTILVDHVDYISAHHYSMTDELKDYYEILGSVAQMENTVRTVTQTAAEVSAKAERKTPVAIALDEWNLLNNWSDGAKRDDVHKFEVSYNLRDALWIGSALNVIHRNCRAIRLANLAQLVNDIAVLYTTPSGMLRRTTYYPLELFANRSGNIVLDVATESPRFSTRNFGDQPYLDASSTYDEAKHRVTVAVVNRRENGDVIGTIELAGMQAKPGGRAFIINGASADAQNTFENPSAVSTKEVSFTATGNKWEQRFPAHSISWLEFDVAG